MTMNIAIAHHSLNIPGGAERLCLSAIEALKREGHNVDLITIEKTAWNILERNFGHITFPDDEQYLVKFRFSKTLPNISAASVYFTAYTFLLLLNKPRKKYNLLINTFGDIINSVADITYIHFPLRAAREFSQTPAFSTQALWHASIPIYNKTLSFLDRISPGKLLTNSKFTQKIVKDVLGRESLVIYPPVDVEVFSSRSFKNQKEANIIATISSYTPKRHLEQILLIAKHAPFAKFVVMGKVNKIFLPTLKNLIRLSKTFHVEDRVELLTNIPFSKITDILSKAKVYLHVMPHDHFGISVVEGMASGCVPVVSQSGGPWLDILDSQQGKYGFSYRSAEEAASICKMLINDEDLRRQVASRAVIRAKEFDKSVFARKLIEVVEDIAN